MPRSIWPLGMLITAAVVLFGAVVGQTDSVFVFKPSDNGTYDFGPVKVGQMMPQVFMITNTGSSSTSSLNLENFTLSGDSEFEITDVEDCTNAALPPDTTCQFTVTYSPTVEGMTNSATLTVMGQNEASGSLDLSGTGAIRHIYWTNNKVSIGRADANDGLNPDQNFISSFTKPVDLRGIAVDTGNLYWANAAAGANTIGRATLDVNGDVMSVEQSFISTLPLPLGTAVDATFIYWANRNDGSIGRADLNQMNPIPIQDFIDLSMPSKPQGVAVDTGHVYWADFQNGRVGRATLDVNGDVMSVTENFIAIAGGDIRGVAVDPN